MFSNKSDDLRAALRHGDMFLCRNDDPNCKTDVWKKFQLIKVKATQELVFGWSACKDCMFVLNSKQNKIMALLNYMELKISWTIVKPAHPKEKLKLL